MKTLASMVSFFQFLSDLTLMELGLRLELTHALTFILPHHPPGLGTIQIIENDAFVKTNHPFGPWLSGE
jgi:hypothetical protein